MTLSQSQVTEFQETVWEYYRTQQRDMPWRRQPTPYNVLVSELMLQQTQVSRVIPKFIAFMDVFPTIESLSRASLSEVLVAWSGLGYNRRAKFLHEAAKKVVDDFGGVTPDTMVGLTSLPGVGQNTAGAILAYAYNQPTVFVETNVRTVLFHHFFTDTGPKVADEELKSIAEQVLDREHAREWYWALMDYGTYLKKTAGGRLNSSKHYKKQPPLKGSLREMRGRILKVLTTGSYRDDELRRVVEADERYDRALKKLVDEGLVEHREARIRLTGHADAR